MFSNPTLDSVKIGQRLRLVRCLTGLTQTTFSKKHDFKRSRYNHWETGFRRVPVESAYQLCITYGLTLDYIYLGAESGLSRMLASELHQMKSTAAGQGRDECTPVLSEE